MSSKYSRKSPTYKSRNPETSNRQLLILLGLFVGLVLIVIWVIGLLVNGLIWLIPISVEKQLGKAIIPTYERLAESSSTQLTLNQLLDGLEEKLPAEQQQERDYRILFIPDKTVNALAFPGDTIVIYQGLLAQAGSENELMMVLGHELGHFANRDHLRGLGRALLVQIAIAAFFGDPGALESAIISGVDAISRSHYSQSQELKADEFGIRLLQKNYGHVAGATDFFERLSKKKRTNIAFLSTHPSPRNRVAKLQRIIKQQGYDLREKAPLSPSLQRS